MSRCLWCHVELPEAPLDHAATPEQLEALRRFSREAYYRLGEAESEPETIAAHLCGECWAGIVGLGERVQA